MEFYELIEKIIGFIPDEFKNLRNISEIAMPWILGICTAATCLFGHKVHTVWKAFLFFWIGFFIPLLILQILFEPTGVLFWVFTVLCVAVGVLCAVYSKKIHKAELFITTFFIVFISVPSYLSFLGNSGSMLAGLFLSVAAAVLSIKYKYITVIVTTSFSGSFMLFNIIESKTGFPHIPITVFAIVFALCGFALQCYVEREELKETYENLKKRKNQMKSVSQKIKQNGKK